VSINRKQKENLVQEMQDVFSANGTFYLLDYANISVAKSMDLRRRLRDSACTLRVVKNRLALRALLEEYPQEIRENFQGPTAIAFTDDNPIALARLLKEFSVQHKILKVKAGLVEGKFLSQARFPEIANLTSRKDLIAQLGFLMAYPLTQFLRSLQAPVSTLGRMMSQLKDKKA
jgi:large subunit ribosomal protein L10